VGRTAFRAYWQGFKSPKEKGEIFHAKQTFNFGCEAELVEGFAWILNVKRVA
jgi:hypothetical protein